MNIDKLRRNQTSRVRLRPSALSIEPDGAAVAYDDVWTIVQVSTEGVVELSNPSTGHVAKLGSDHVHHFDSDPPSSSLNQKQGFLILTVQIYLQGARLWLEPVGLRAHAASQESPPK
jgi:hypothetical protein